MTDPIEAMADSIEAQLSAEDGWYVGTPELRGMCIDFATAAYAALRETLVPVAYTPVIIDSGLLHALSPVKHSATPTPLFALPEIKP